MNLLRGRGIFVLARAEAAAGGGWGDRLPAMAADGRGRRG